MKSAELYYKRLDLCIARYIPRCANANDPTPNAAGLRWKQNKTSPLFCKGFTDCGGEKERSGGAFVALFDPFGLFGIGITAFGRETAETYEHGLIP